MGRPVRTSVVGCDPAGIEEAARCVSSGGVVAFPTDTVYGLGCDPFDDDAVGRIYAAKGRPASKPLPVLGASAADLSPLAVLEGRAARLAERFWPGPLTIVARVSAAADASRGSSISPRLVSGSGKIAVRVPGGRCAQGLLARCGPLVGTSANMSGRPPCATAAACERELGGRIPVIVDGGSAGPGGSGVSTVVEAGPGGPVRIVRAGVVSEAEIERML